MIDDYEQILLKQARDIEGLQEVSIWPLSLGWWLIIAIIVTILSVIIARHIRKTLYQKSWKYKVEKRLDKFSELLNDKNGKRVVSELNEIIKRIAIKEYGRIEVAKLNGKEWLKWLSQHDPKGFNWNKKGEILITYPYMPNDSIIKNKSEILSLIKTTKGWL